MLLVADIMFTEWKKNNSGEIPVMTYNELSLEALGHLQLVVDGYQDRLARYTNHEHPPYAIVQFQAGLVRLHDTCKLKAVQVFLIKLCSMVICSLSPAIRARCTQQAGHPQSALHPSLRHAILAQIHALAPYPTPVPSRVTNAVCLFSILVMLPSMLAKFGLGTVQAFREATDPPSVTPCSSRSSM